MSAGGATIEASKRAAGRGKVVTYGPPVPATYVTSLVNSNARLLRSRPSETMEIQEPLQDVSNWLQWAVILDEQLWPEGGYVGRRDRDEWGRVIPGLRHAWNLIRHHGRRMDEFVVIRPSDGWRFPLTFPLAFRDTVWRPFGELPVIPTEKGTSRLPDEETAYRQHLAGQGVRLVADGVTGFLVHEAT